MYVRIYRLCRFLNVHILLMNTIFTGTCAVEVDSQIVRIDKVIIKQNNNMYVHKL